MKTSYFGTDGIRGPYGSGPVSPEFFVRVGYALACALRITTHIDRPLVVLGTDPRESSQALHSALTAGLLSAGADVAFVGVVPTPAVAHLCCLWSAQAGAVISASHNLYQDNGLKIFGASGHKLNERTQSLLESILPSEMRQVAPCGVLRDCQALGLKEYVDFVVRSAGPDFSLQGMTVAVDCANGAASTCAQQVLERAGARVVALSDAPDGVNINASCGATCPENIAFHTTRTGAHVGLSLDGDADRLVMSDETGTVLDGDMLLYLMTLDRLQDGPVAGVAGTVMTNMGVETAIRALGVDFVRTAVGDKYLVQELTRRGWHLGGESSGHLVDLSKHTTGDALVSALSVLKAVQKSGKALSELCRNVQLYPSRLTKIKMPADLKWEDPTFQAELTQACDLAKAELADQGRILVRKSGTEAVVRVLVESSDSRLTETVSQALTDDLEACLRSHKSAVWTPA